MGWITRARVLVLLSQPGLKCSLFFLRRRAAVPGGPLSMLRSSGDRVIHSPPPCSPVRFVSRHDSKLRWVVGTYAEASEDIVATCISEESPTEAHPADAVFVCELAAWSRAAGSCALFGLFASPEVGSVLPSRTLNGVPLLGVRGSSVK